MRCIYNYIYFIFYVSFDFEFSGTINIFYFTDYLSNKLPINFDSLLFLKK